MGPSDKNKISHFLPVNDRLWCGHNFFKWVDRQIIIFLSFFYKNNIPTFWVGTCLGVKYLSTMTLCEENLQFLHCSQILSFIVFNFHPNFSINIHVQLSIYSVNNSW